LSEINCAATTFVSIETGQFDGQIMTPSERVDQETVFAFIQSLPADDPDHRGIQRIDTGANVIFLTGKKAYKIKRDVQYPFLDYSTLALRKRACEREIELNAPHAPQIYLSAKPITRSPEGHLEIDGDGKPVEWLVEMTQFDRANELERLAEGPPLSTALADDLAQMMVNAHDHAPKREGQRFFDELSKYLAQNEAAFAETPELFPPEEAARLSHASRELLSRLKPLILSRGDTGLIRLCHGDAHTRNIVLIEGKPMLFDAVEFSDDIATCDVLYDLAYLLMDLWHLDQRATANRIFNRYLDISRRVEDQSGLAALPFYLMMRACLRAKISASNARFQTDPTERATLEDDARSYFRLAQEFLAAEQPYFAAIGGFSGTGKTTAAYGLAPHLSPAPGARVLRTDVERKRALGLNETDAPPEGTYTKEKSDSVYAQLQENASTCLMARHSVIFDGVLARDTERQRLESIAAENGAAFKGIWLTAPLHVAKSRVLARTNDASDATPEVIETQAGYDLGEMTWDQVEAGTSANATLASILSSLKLPKETTD